VHRLAGAPDLTRTAAKKPEARETRLQQVTARRKPEVIDRLDGHDSQHKGKRTAARRKCQVIAHKGTILGGAVSRNGGLVVPNVHTRKEMNFPVPVEQTNAEVHFFRSILARAGHIESTFANSRGSKDVPATDKQMSWPSLGPWTRFVTFWAQDVECGRRYYWIRFHVLHGNTDFVAIYKPCIIVQTKVEVRITLTH